MRVLVTSTPGVGHNRPMLPVVLELRDRGHDLHWILGEESLGVVTDAGIEATVAGMPVADRHAELLRRHPEVWTLPIPEARALAFGTLFGDLAARSMVDAVRERAVSWRPDVVLHDAAELAAPLVATSLGLPTVCHGFGEVVLSGSVRRAADEVAPLWEASGLTPDAYAGLYRGLYIDIYPPSLRAADMGYITDVQLACPARGPLASGSLVYVTFGTVFNQVDEGFRAAVLGAASAADEVLVTVGSAGDPALVGAVPDHVRVERYVPQDEVLPRCAAVVCHGGSGTVLASLAHGVPVLCLPRGADQFSNGANLSRVGAGAMLMGEDVTREAVRGIVDELLGSTTVRDGARTLRDEIAAMPPPPEVARAIEAFVGRP